MKDAQVQIRISAETKAHWESVAARLGISMSSFCRLMVIKGERLEALESQLVKTFYQSLTREDYNVR